MEKILLGTGPLTWNSTERKSDRYGSVFLHPTSTHEEYLEKVDFDPRICKAHAGKKGKLVAEVTGTRESSHIGDLFHQIFPEIPEVGEEIELGSGELFYELQNGKWHAVGLRPDDRRSEFWLNPKKLYRAHEQSVKLWFVLD